MKSRDQLKKLAELYLSASFFKMKRVTSGDKFTPLTKLDATINAKSGATVPMANANWEQRFFPEREKMPKFPKGK